MHPLLRHLLPGIVEVSNESSIPSEVAKTSLIAINDCKTSPDKVRSSNVKTFMGFVVPEEPKEPSDEECCMSGCAVCVYDLYDEARTDYKKSVESLRSSLRLLNVPEDTWPQNIQTAPRKLTERKKSVTMSAFEELEMRLKQKQEQQAISVG